MKLYLLVAWAITASQLFLFVIFGSIISLISCAACALLMSLTYWWNRT